MADTEGGVLSVVSGVFLEGSGVCLPNGCRGSGVDENVSSAGIFTRISWPLTMVGLLSGGADALLRDAKFDSFFSSSSGFADPRRETLRSA